MASGFPDYQMRAFTSAENFEQKKLIAGAVETSTSFVQEVKSVLIYNDGPNPVYLNFDAVADTGYFKLPSKAWLMIDLRFTDLHAICAAGETATLTCIGTY